jgi:hypothetical protein
MRRHILAAVLAAAAVLGACERRAVQEEPETTPGLTLTVETPEALDWGGSGMLRISLVNEGDAMAEGGIVEVYVPDWLEFGTVEPPGTAVTVVSGESETRLSYQLTDSLPPGERRTVVQHLRVLPPEPPALDAPADTVETVQLPPSNQLVRARLLTPAGEPAGVEVHATLQFTGVSGRVPPGARPPPDSMPADTLLRDTTRTDTTRADTVRGRTGDARSPAG